MSEKHDRVPVFAGDEQKYPAWLMAFKAYCKVRKCKQALTKNPNLPEKELDEYPDTADGKKQAKAVEQNDEAIAQLTLALQGDAMLSFIVQTYTDEFPDGLAYRVMELLEERFAESTLMKEANLNDELAAIRMGETEDPTKMLDTLATIKARYTKLKLTVTETSLMAHALAAAPKHYKSSMIQEQHRLGDKATLEDFRKIMVATYKATYGTAAQKREEKADVKETALAQLLQGTAPNQLQLALAAVLQQATAKQEPAKQETARPFRGQCHGCKKTGHMVRDCPDKDKNETAQCKHCKMDASNHAEDSCWYKEGNQVPAHVVRKMQKQLKEYLQAANVETPGVSGNDDMLCCKFLDTPNLRDRNLYVADSAASAHATGNKDGLTELTAGDPNMKFVTADGTKKAPAAAGKLRVTVCDKNGKALQDATFQDVQYFEHQPFNLISTNRLVTAGWKPGGNKNAIWFTKGKMQLKFDVKILTKSGGCLFAARMERRDTGNETTPLEYISVPVLSEEDGEGEDAERAPDEEDEDDDTAPSDEEDNAETEDAAEDGTETEDDDDTDDEDADEDSKGTDDEDADDDAGKESTDDDESAPEAPPAADQDEKDDGKGGATPTTRSGRLVRPPTRYKDVAAAGGPLLSEEAGEGFNNETWITVVTTKARFRKVSRVHALEGRV